MDCIEYVTSHLSDEILFPLLQLGVAAFAAYAWYRARPLRQQRGNGGVKAEITRGPSTMLKFYAAYGSITGVLIAIVSASDVANQHRVLWILVDVVLVAYVCLVNAWFRNALLGWASALTKLEKR